MDGESISPGAEGFLNIGLEGAPSSENQATDPSQTPGQGAGAERSAPESDDLSAAERVAASLAADLEADGIEIPEPGQDDTGDDLGQLSADDIDSLTPEQLKALARRAIEGEQEIASGRVEQIRAQVEQAEETARMAVRQQYEQEVLGTSRPHYRGQFVNRAARQLRAAIRQAESQGGDVVQMFVNGIGAEFEKVVDAMLTYEDEQAEQYEGYADQAAQAARESIPGLRQVYAERLINEYKLPLARETLVKIMFNPDNTPRDINGFRNRAAELQQLQGTVINTTIEARNQARKTANQNLGQQRITRPAGGTTVAPRKTPALKGSAEEGAEIMSWFKRD